jgi:F0F1-type ATP synthase assembly protein I
VVGQVGCVTIFIVIGSLIAGLWLDNQFNTKPLFLILLLVLSAPVTVVIMLWIVRSITSKMEKPTPNQIETQEEAKRGTNKE